MLWIRIWIRFGCKRAKINPQQQLKITFFLMLEEEVKASPGAWTSIKEA
jgi:hypothetical protein